MTLLKLMFAVLALTLPTIGALRAQQCCPPNLPSGTCVICSLSNSTSGGGGGGGALYSCVGPTSGLAYTSQTPCQPPTKKDLIIVTDKLVHLRSLFQCDDHVIWLRQSPDVRAAVCIPEGK